MSESAGQYADTMRARPTLGKPPADVLARGFNRGLLQLVCLAALDSPLHGYALRLSLRAYGFYLKDGTLYPLLRRLAAFGYLKSAQHKRNGRALTLYTSTKEGRTFLRKGVKEWRDANASFEALLASRDSAP